MRTLRVRVLSENGKWFFRWDNVHVPTACDIKGPYDRKEDAEAERQRFVDSEREKPFGTVFEWD
jgi:hypothetical protein